MEKKNIHIKILEFGINRTEGFTYDEIINAKELKKLKDSEKIIIGKYLNNAYLNHFNNAQNIAVIFETMFIVVGCDKDYKKYGYKDKNTKYILNYDSHFKYIDYKKLEETREMAKNATKGAKRAMYFAITTIIISIILTFLQIISPIEIEEEQINKIVNTIKYTNIK